MSTNGSDSDDGDDGPGTREVAHRLFAAEFDDCDFQFSESDEERAPNYVITPTGARVNRLFLIGVLTELEPVNESMLRARIVDPTGAFVVYAGQYQPDALAFLERADPPAFLAVTGKARTYQPEDSDVVYSSVRPESISEVDADARDRWVVSTAERTLDRVGTMAAALDSGLAGDNLRERLEAAGVDPALAQGIVLAREHYGTTGAYLAAVRSLALDAARVVAGERDEVEGLTLAPDAAGDAPPLASLRTAETPTIESGAADPTGPDEHAGGVAEADDGSSETATADDSTVTDAGGETATDASTAGGIDSPEPTASDPTDSADPSTTADASGDEAATTTASTTGGTAGDTTTVDDAGRGGDGGGSVDLDTGSADADGGSSGIDAGSAGDDGGSTDLEAGTTDDDIGGFEESTGLGDAAGEGDEDDLEEFEPGEFDEGEVDPEEFEGEALSDAEREEVEAEFGTDFSTGTEVESEPDLEPDLGGEAEAEGSPEPAAGADAGSDAAAATEGSTDDGAGPAGEPDLGADAVGEPDADAETAAGPDTDAEAEPEAAAEAEAIDIDDAVMEAMADLDDGDGAEHDAVVDRVVDRTGASADEVAEAIQDALMSGQCYEPDDDLLKPI